MAAKKFDRRNIVLIILLALAVLIVIRASPIITGAFTAGGQEWESKLDVIADNSIEFVTAHISFENYKPANCADGIYVEAEGQAIEFSTENEVLADGLCQETDVVIRNIIYNSTQSMPAPAITGYAGSEQITYTIYYGLVSPITEEVPAASAPEEAPSIPHPPALTIPGNSEPSNTSEWPMLHNYLNHTGYTTAQGPLYNSPLWTYQFSGANFAEGPAVANGIVYTGAFSSFTSYNIFAINASTGGLIWKSSIGSDTYFVPAIADGILYLGDSYYGDFYALNAITGGYLWSYDANIGITDSAAVSNGRVYFGSSNGTMFALNATNGGFLWKYDTSGAYNNYLSSPAVVNDIVYFGAGPLTNKFYAINATNGNHIWNYTGTSRFSFSAPAVADGIVYVGSDNGNIYAFNATTGGVKWTNAVGGGVNSPAVANGLVYFSCDNNYLYALNATNGNLKWNYYISGTAYGQSSSPSVANDIVYVGSRDHYLYAINATSGALIWRYLTSMEIYSSPAIIDNAVYFTNWNYVYAIAVVAIDHCQNLTQPYMNYIVTQNLAGNQSGSTCLDIQASNINLNCNGYSITGNESGTTYAVRANTTSYSNVTNCIIKNYTYGVYLESASNNNIIHNDISNCSEGILLYQSTNNRIADNIIYNNSDGYGIDLFLNSSYNVIDNNTVYNSKYGAYLLEDANYNTLTNNKLYNNSEYGLRLHLGSYNTISTNIFNSNSLTGIYINSSSNNNFTDNTATNNTNWDFYSTLSSNNTIISLTTNDTTSSFAYDGDVALKSAVSPAADLFPYANISHYLNVTNDTTAWMYLNISYTSFGNLNESTLQIWKYSSGWSLLPSPNGVDESANYVYANITNFSSIFAPMGLYPPPTVTSAELYPVAPKPSDNLTLNAICVSVSGYPLTLYWDVYNNSVKVPGLSNSDAIINGTLFSKIIVESGNTSENEQWKAEVWCGDGAANSSKVNTSARIIHNRPDLIITRISYFPLGPQTGQLVTIDATIKNQDVLNASAFNVSFYLDDIYKAQNRINSLENDSETTTSFTWTADSSLHQIKIVADSAEEVAETDETNNNKTEMIGVDWPMFHQTVERYGFANTNGPTTSNIRWSFDIPSENEPYGTWASPVVAGGVVYLTAGNSTYAIDETDGSLIWGVTKTDLSLSYPAVADGIVYIGYGSGGNNSDNNMYALNATNGNTIWNYTVGGRIYASHAAVSDGVVYFGANDNNTYALNASNGNLIWNHTFEQYDIINSSPTIADGILYVGAAATGSCPGCAGAESTLYALNITNNGSEIWNFTFTAAVMPDGVNVEMAPAIADGYVYVGAWGNNIFYALNATTGSTIWSYDTGVTAIVSSPAVANGMVYFGSYNNNVYALNATDGNLVWNYATGNLILSSPAVANDIVYIGARDNYAYALNATTGGLIWKYLTLSGTVDSSPAVVNGTMYICGYKKLYAFAPDRLPTHTTPLLTSTNPDTNDTNQNLICYNRSTSDADGDPVTNIYNWYRNNNPIMVLNMPFESSNNLITKDYSGHGNNGTVNGAAWTSSGRVGGAYTFDGANDYIDCGDDSSLNITDEITLTAWVKSNSDGYVIVKEYPPTTGGPVCIYDEPPIDDCSSFSGDVCIDGIGFAMPPDNFTRTSAPFFIPGATSIDAIEFNIRWTCGPAYWTFYLNGVEIGNDSNSDITCDCAPAPVQYPTTITITGPQLNSYFNFGGPNTLTVTTVPDPITGFVAVAGYDATIYYTAGALPPEYTRVPFSLSTMNGGEFFIMNNDTEYIVAAGGNINDNNWHHLAAAYDGSKMKIYVDGILKATNTNYTGDLPTNDLTVWIGRNYKPTNTTGYFNGTIDEVQIYNRALSAEQIYQRYLDTKDGYSSKQTIVANETDVGDNWVCKVTPNDGKAGSDGITLSSPSLEINEAPVPSEVRRKPSVNVTEELPPAEDRVEVTYTPETNEIIAEYLENQALVETMIKLKEGVSPPEKIIIKYKVNPPDECSNFSAISISDNVALACVVIDVNIPNEDIESASIKFKVSRISLSDLRIDLDSIGATRLLIDAGGEQLIEVKEVGRDLSYVYYEANTPGFSKFLLFGLPIPTLLLDIRPVQIALIILLITSLLYIPLIRKFTKAEKFYEKGELIIRVRNNSKSVKRKARNIVVYDYAKEGRNFLVYDPYTEKHYKFKEVGAFEEPSKKELAEIEKPTLIKLKDKFIFALGSKFALDSQQELFIRYHARKPAELEQPDVRYKEDIFKK